MNITVIVNARNTVRKGIVRPPMITALSPRNELNNAENTTAIVVVFNPPAVEPGDPPININTIINVRHAVGNSTRSTVEYPAVRLVIDR